MRGKKHCPECLGWTAARKRICECGHEFISKNVLKDEIVDWTEIGIGSYIKVIAGTGPYYTLSRNCEDGIAGDRICMGHVGTFKVIGRREDGLEVIGVSVLSKGGFAFLYMGPTIENPDTGIVREAHRLKTVARKSIRDGN